VCIYVIAQVRMCEIMRLRLYAFAVSTNKAMQAAMNWAKGLFRFWIVLSILWVAVWVVAMRPDQQLIQHNESYASAKELAGDLRQTLNDMRQSAPDGNLTKMQTAILRAKGERLRRADLKVQRSREALVGFFVIGPGLSAGMIVIGAALLWALRGFKRQSQ